MSRPAGLAKAEPEVGREHLLALHLAASLLVEGFRADAVFLEEALRRGDDPFVETLLSEVERRATACLRVVDGITGKEAERNAFFLRVEEVAKLASPDHVASGLMEEVQMRLIAQVGPVTFVRLHWRMIAPALERKTTDAAIERALQTCAVSGPGQRGGNETKGSALSKIWTEISGVTVEPSTFEPSLSKARSASRKSRP